MRRRPKKGSIRNVVTGRSDGYTGRVPFARLGQKTVAYESLLEHDFLLLTSAFEHDICEIDSQPFCLEVHTETGTHEWTPDYRIARRSGICELVEIKPIEEVHPDRAKTNRTRPDAISKAKCEANNRFRSLQSAAYQKGYKFRLLTEDELRIEPRLGNAALLLRYAGCPFPATWVTEARLALVTATIANVADLQSALPQRDAFALALHLAWLGELRFDPANRFSRDSRFIWIHPNPVNVDEPSNRLGGLPPHG